MQRTIGTHPGDRSLVVQVPTGHILDNVGIKVNSDSSGSSDVEKIRIHKSLLITNDERGEKRKSTSEGRRKSHPHRTGAPLDSTRSISGS